MSSIDLPESPASFDSFLMDDLNLYLDSSIIEKSSDIDKSDQASFEGEDTSFCKSSSINCYNESVSSKFSVCKEKLALNKNENFSLEIESAFSHSDNNDLGSEASRICLSHKIPDVSTAIRKPNLIEPKDKDLFFKNQAFEKYELLNSSKAKVKVLTSNSSSFALTFPELNVLPKKSSTFFPETENKHLSKNLFSAKTLNEISPSLLSPTKTGSKNKRQLLPPLQFKTYEEYHRNKNNSLYAEARNDSEFPPSKPFVKQTISPITYPTKRFDSPESSSLLIARKDSIERRKTSSLYRKPESSHSSKAQQNSASPCTSTNDKVYRTNNQFYYKNNSLGSNFLLDSKNKYRGALLPPVSEPILSTDSSPSERTSSISEASPDSENILTDSILNIFQMIESSKNSNSFKPSVFKENPINNPNKSVPPNEFELSPIKFIHGEVKESVPVHISTPNGLPPKYSRSEQHDLFTHKSFLLNDDPFKSPCQNQAFFNRLDEIIKSQRKCVGLLEEIRDKLPSSKYFGVSASKPPVSKDVLNKIQDLQDQLYLGLEELNLYHIAEDIGTRSKLNKKYLH